ncbi:MAG: zinc ribbon domain-containing protein [Thermoanaerobaculia bacterium]|nr:zinc ribbon domain-containing protein [Thermoanaerobaculia bacterium]
MTVQTDAPVTTKVRKFPCEQCGADLVWNPGVVSLKCPYCSFVKEIPQTAEGVVERPIEEALGARKSIGWGMERKAFHCTRCGSSTTFEPGQAAGACAFCGTPAVVEAPLDQNMVRPEGVLPFRVERDAALGKFRSWVKGLWFRPNDLKYKSALTHMQGVYVPFWLFDAATHSAWTAEAGHYYYVSVQVQENGRMVTRQQQRVRWVPAAGRLELFFDDLPTIASRGLDAGLAQSIEPFPTEGLAPYDKAYLSGFIAEEYAVDVKEALLAAKQRMEEEIRTACAGQIPGDTYRNLVVRTGYSGVAYKNALLPIWIAAYQYGGKAYRFIVNGVTGKMSGTAPWSWVKITFAVLATLAVFAIFLALQN